MIQQAASQPATWIKKNYQTVAVPMVNNTNVQFRGAFHLSLLSLGK